MARQNLDRIYSLPAAAAIARGIGLLVNTSGQFAVAGANVYPHAVADADAASGEQARALIIGPVTPLVSGAAITVGLRLTTDATGRYVAATTGQLVSAIALEAVGAANKMFTGMLVGNVGVAP